jgi:hypothetical protein
LVGDLNSDMGVVCRPVYYYVFGNGGIVKMTLNAIFSLKLENNEILPILSVAILKIKMTLNAM